MKTYKIKIVKSSVIAAEFNKYYGTHLSWYDVNMLLFGDRWVSGIRSYILVDESVGDRDVKDELDEFLSEEFPNEDVTYIDTED